MTAQAVVDAEAEAGRALVDYANNEQKRRRGCPFCALIVGHGPRCEVGAVLRARGAKSQAKTTEPPPKPSNAVEFAQDYVTQLRGGYYATVEAFGLTSGKRLRRLVDEEHARVVREIADMLVAYATRGAKR